MKLSKVKLRNKHSGVILKVNEADWAQDLGRNKYRGFERVGEINSGRKEDVVQTGINESAPDAVKLNADDEPAPDTVKLNTNEKEQESKPSRAQSRRGRHADK